MRTNRVDTGHVAHIGHLLLAVVVVALATVPPATVAGAAADGSSLEVVDRTSIGDANGHGAFLSVTLGRLAEGANTITLTVSDEAETVAPTNTTVVVTRGAPES